MKQTDGTAIISTTLVVLGTLWTIFIINFLTCGWINHLLSVKPREIGGLLGI